MADTTFTPGTVISSAWLNDINDAVYNQFSGGTAARTLAAKLGDICSVKDFGAVGDGATDDSVAIQAAFDTGKTVRFPVGTYNISTTINVGYTPHVIGERGVSTIIRQTTTNAVFNFASTNEYSLFENLRIGGAGATGMQVAGGGYGNYLSTLSMRNVHFEGDLRYGINANMIHCHGLDSTWGYYTQTAANTNFQAIVSSFSGGLNTNINKFTNCKFFNGGDTVATIDFNAGLILSFENCAWENNGRDLATSNIQNCVLDNCYTERGKHATSIFDFGQTRVATYIRGGQFNGGSMPAASAMFQATDSIGKLVIEDADISTTASAYTYKNSASGLNTLPTNGMHQFIDCRLQGNAIDPLLWLDNLVEGAPISFTPSPNGLTVVLGGGSVTYTGLYAIKGRRLDWVIKIAPAGGATTAATANTTFFFPINGNIPLPQISVPCVAINESTAVDIGSGYSYSGNGRIYTPTWAATSSTIVMSGWYYF